MIGAGGSSITCLGISIFQAFGVHELATAEQHGSNLVTVAFNNGVYENVRRNQQRFYTDRLHGSLLHNPDFIKLSESFDVTGYRADSPSALRTMLAHALDQDAPR